MLVADKKPIYGIYEGPSVIHGKNMIDSNFNI